MKANIIDKTEGLLNNPKRAIAIVIILIVVVVIYFVFRTKIKTWIEEIKNSMDANRALEEEVSATGEKMSFSESQYRNYAQRLYNAMNGIGSNNDAIYSVFNEMRNTADVLKLVSVFGTRDGQQLSEWLYSEWFLSITKINKILTDKGIAYQF
ncbi:MAG: hypothetical protein LBU51_08380 [Bacteroidales bacterium]|jgi:predicted PurR-regulated permease PerM|nr:hypothetical protein [Bacteroidales bacterium]